jgi:hypothetical protein
MDLCRDRARPPTKEPTKVRQTKANQAKVPTKETTEEATKEIRRSQGNSHRAPPLRLLILILILRKRPDETKFN